MTRPAVRRTWPIEDEVKMARLIRIGLSKEEVTEASFYFLDNGWTGEKCLACAIGMAVIGTFDDVTKALVEYGAVKDQRTDISTEIILNDFHNLTGIHPDLLAEVNNVHSTNRHLIRAWAMNAEEIATHLEEGTFLQEVNRKWRAALEIQERAETQAS